MSRPPLYPVARIGSTSPEFRAELRAVSERLTVDPTDLAAIISFESGFNPKAKNPSSSATGLIQWIPTTAAALYRLTVAQIAAMSATEQLALVEKYFAGVRGRGLGLHELYMLVWNGSPAAMDQILGVSDAPGHSGAVYRQNRALDLNKDGRITAGEASAIVRSIAAAARRLPPLPDDDPKAPASTVTSVSSSGPPLSLPSSYRVKVGDTCWALAGRLAGKNNRWRELYSCNPRYLVDSLKAGASLTLPPGWKSV